MTPLQHAAQQALEALEGWDNYGKWVWPESALEQAKRNTTESLAALRAALAEQIVTSDYPNSRQRKPLTDEELDRLWREMMSEDWEHREFARAIEEAHGIKENP